MKNKTEIFISYAWKDAHEKAEDSREKIVDEICRIFAGHGYEILRDKNHLTYKQSIRNFMERLGKGNYIIAVISDKYMKSEYCMYEAYHMFQSDHFRERVFPIVLKDTDIFSIEGQTDYMAYWGNQLNELQKQAERLKDINPTMTMPLVSRRRDIELMSYIIADFMSTVADMNVLTPEIHSASGYTELIKVLEEKINSDRIKLVEKGRGPKQKEPMRENKVGKSTSNQQTTIENNQRIISNKVVYMSYAWGGESERIVNELDVDLQTKGIMVVRDKRDLGFKGMIRDFMQQIGRGHAIILVISDKYLKSPRCMFELVEIARNKDLYDRVFPIVLGDADIYNPVNRIKYIKHWEEKLKELDEAMRSISSANLQGVRDEIDSYDEIRDNISNLTFLLKDMNTLTPDMHRDNDFRTIFDAVMAKLEE